VGGKNKVAFVDKNWKVFSYQYHLKKQKWIKGSGWTNQDCRLRCGACHTIGLNPKTKRFIEINVGCEVCHGPGRKHARAIEMFNGVFHGKGE
jgi:DnaJ-class molecular chaperone